MTDLTQKLSQQLVIFSGTIVKYYLFLFSFEKNNYFWVCIITILYYEV